LTRPTFGINCFKKGEEMVSGLVTLVNTNSMKPPISPLGLDYLAQSLVERGLKVAVLDLCFSPDPLSEIENYFTKNHPRIVGINIRNTDDCVYASQDFFLPGIRRIVDEVKKRTSAPIVLGGSGFSVMPKRILGYCDINLGMVGDCEESFPLLIQHILKGRDIKGIPGLIYKDGNGLVSTGFPHLDLRKLPLQSRDFVDNERYFEEGGMGSIETKRGCNQGCIYCADPLIKGKKIRLRPPDHVVWELKRLLQKGINYVHICDSEFNLPPEHAESVCQEIIKERVHTKLHWYAYCSPSPFSRKLAVLMHKAGCAGVDFGVDSGSDKMLKTLGRSFSSREIEETAKLCHRHGIVFMYDLLLGGPGEDKETLRDTIELMKRVGPDRVGITIGARVYPGTSLSSSILKQGPFEKNRHLHGETPDRDFFRPIFYLSSQLGDGIFPHVEKLVGDDERFFFPKDVGKSKNYNYNQNIALIEAIRKGHRGAYWDILRRMQA